ncbi:MAG: PAS domain-containing protein [Bacteroidota bacterium]
MSGKKSYIPVELETPSMEFLAASEKIGLHWWYWDPVERQLTVSPALVALLGYKPEEFDPSLPSIYKNIHPDDEKENFKRIQRLINGEDSLYEIEFRIRDSKGEWQWYYNRGTVIRRDETGKGIFIGGITMDISGQYKQLMSKVQEKDKFEFIFKNTNEAIVIFELEKGKAVRVLDANKAATDLFDRSPEELMKSFSEKLFRNDRVGPNGELFRQVAEKGFGRVELEIEIGEKKVRWLDISAHAFNLTGENLIIAIVADKTKDKRTEAALRESERLYRSLFDAADDAIGLFTMDREMILINKAFYSNFGYEREEFLDLGWMGTVHPEDRRMLHALGGQLLQEGNLSVDYRMMHKSGQYIYVSAKSVIIKGDPGEKDLVLTIIRDVTERREAMEELEHAKEKAEESDKLKSAFLANMSHEIRTPMNSIIGFSNLLVNPGVSDEARDMYVQRIVRNSELLLALISDIIDLAKIESGQLPIIYGRLLINTLIGDMKQYALDELNRLGKSGIEIVTYEEEVDCEIETDVVRVVQIMRNLVNNAIKFTETGSVTIGCKRALSESNFILFVEDSGIGIEPENFDLIFDQFRQIDGSKTRRFGGTGLGLAICKNLVHMMGGRIWVESIESKGTLFQVELPINANRKLKPEEKEIKFPGGATSPVKSLTVMVVDDAQDSVELMRELFTGLGHTVVTAESGYEALRLLDKQSVPDLVSMDVQMPFLTGTDTMKIMKERYPSIKVIAQSAHALVGDRARFLREGFDGYLPKPFTSEQLEEVLKLLS